MKRSLLAVAIFLLAFGLSSAEAAFPQQINYQGKLTNAGNIPLTGTYSIVFTIYDAASAGTNKWTETQTVTTESGFFNVILGSGTPIGTTVFDGNDRWLGIQVGADAEMTPRQKLVSVGNAFYAYNSGLLGGHNWAEVPTTENMVLKAGDTMTGTLTIDAAQAITISGSSDSTPYGLTISNTGVGDAGGFTSTLTLKNSALDTLKLILIKPDYGGFGGLIANNDLYLLKGSGKSLYFGPYSDSGGPTTEAILDANSNMGIGTSEGLTSKLTVAGTIETTSGGIKFPDATIQTTAGGGGTPGGSNQQVQYNDNGVFSGEANFIFDKSSKLLSLAGNLYSSAEGNWTIQAKNRLTTGAGYDLDIKAGNANTSGNSGALNLYGGLGGDNGGDVKIYTGGSGTNWLISWSQADYNGAFGETFKASKGRRHYDNSDTHTYSGYLYNFRRSRGNWATPTIVGNGDILGAISFEGYNNVGGYAGGTYLQAKVNGSVTGAVPTDLLLHTNHYLVLDGGNVGIGSSEPASPLTVGGTIETTTGGVKFPDGTTQTTASGATNFVSKTGDTMTGRLTVEATIESTVGGIKFPDGTIQMTSAVTVEGGYVAKVGDTMTGTLTIDAASANLIVKQGQAGIGTIEPTAPLEIYHSDSTTAEPHLLLNSDGVGGRQATIAFAHNGAVQSQIRKANGGGLFIENFTNSDIRFWTNDTARMVIENSGNVGIGTIEPASLLTVAGTIETTLGGIKFPNGSIQTIAATGGTPGGADTNIQYNDGGSTFNGSSEMSWLKATGELRVGPYTAAGGRFIMSGNSTSASSFYLVEVSDNTNPSTFSQYKSRGAFGAYTPTLASDTLGQLQFGGNGATAANAAGFSIGAKVEGKATELWSATAHGSQLLLSVTPNTSTTNATALTLDQDKHATFYGTIETTVGGIKFPDATIQTTAATAGNYVAKTGDTMTGILTLESDLTIQATKETGRLIFVEPDTNASMLNIQRSGSTEKGILFEATSLDDSAGLAIDALVGSTTPADAAVSILVGKSDGLGGYQNLAADETAFGLINNDDTTLLHVLGSGHVGIGTSEPASKLTVAGTIESTLGGVKFPDATIQTTAASLGNYVLKAGDTMTGTLTIDAASANMVVNQGRIGVGTTNPQAPLHVVGTSGLARFERNTTTLGAQWFQWYNPNTTDGNTADVVFSTDTTGAGATSTLALAGIRSIFNTHNHSTRNSSLQFLTANPTYAVKMTLLGNGNFGIGSSEPASKLTVAGTIEMTSGGVKFSDATIQTTAASLGNYVLKAGDTMTGGLTITSTEGLTVTGTNDSSTYNITVTNGGGDSGGDATKLTMYNNQNTGAADSCIVGLRSAATGDFTGAGYLMTSNNLLLITGTDKTIGFATTNGGPDVKMTMLSSGYFGIGSAEPASPLTVAGTIETTLGGVKFPDGTIQTNALHHLRCAIVDPATAYGKTSTICLVPKIDAAITVVSLEVTCNAAPNTTEVTGDVKWADAFIGKANAAVINDFDTTSGVRSDSSITSPNVATNKTIYLSFDATPEATLTQIAFDITYKYQ